MAWDFSTEPEFQEKLDWMDEFVRDEVEPLDFLFRGSATPFDPPEEARPIIGPLKQQVRDHGLWACHLGPELGGHGYRQLKLALMNEILGRTGGARPSSAARPRTPATPRSLPTTARRSRRTSTSSPSSTARSCPATR